MTRRLPGCCVCPNASRPDLIRTAHARLEPDPGISGRMVSIRAPRSGVTPDGRSCQGRPDARLRRPRGGYGIASPRRRRAARKLGRPQASVARTAYGHTREPCRVAVATRANEMVPPIGPTQPPMDADGWTHCLQALAQNCRTRADPSVPETAPYRELRPDQTVPLSPLR